LPRLMCASFEAERTAITRVSHWPYRPLDGIGDHRRDHPWRKPKPGMLLQAASDLGLDPARCAILGDKMSDMEAGAAAGIGLRVLIGPGNAKIGELRYEGVADLREALALFRSRFALPDQQWREPSWLALVMLDFGSGIVRPSRQVALCTPLTVLEDRFYRPGIAIVLSPPRPPP